MGGLVIVLLIIYLQYMCLCVAAVLLGLQQWLLHSSTLAALFAMVNLPPGWFTRSPPLQTQEAQPRGRVTRCSTTSIPRPRWVSSAQCQCECVHRPCTGKGLMQTAHEPGCWSIEASRSTQTTLLRNLWTRATGWQQPGLPTIHSRSCRAFRQRERPWPACPQQFALR